MRFLSIFIILCGFLYANEVINSITSDFTQIITSTENDTIKYDGNFQALNENKNNFALWDYKTPIKKKIYYTNNEAVIIEPDLEQAIITPIKDIPDISSVLNQAINTNKQTNKDVKITIADTDYNISFKDNIPTKITYIDNLDNKIDILLKNTVVNIQIDKRTFKPQIPRGFDIITY